MLTDELREAFLDRADLVATEAPRLLADLETKIARRRRQRIVAISGGTALLTALAVVGAILAADDHSTSRTTSVGTGNEVPCATPDRTVPDYLGWACPSGAVSYYVQREIDQIQTFYAPGSYSSGTQPEDVAVRVLGFGPLPNSRPGSTVVDAEVWLRGGDGPAQIITSWNYHALAAPPFDRGTRPVADPAPAGGDNHAISSASAPLFLTTPPSLELPRIPDACAQLADSAPKPGHSYLAACTDTVLARPDVAAVRLVSPTGTPGRLIPVHDRLAGLNTSATGRRGWTVEALDSDGTVLGSIPFHSS